MRNEDETHTPWQLLRLTYGLVPIVAGADKFTNLLTDWKKYMSPVALDVLPIAPSSFMMIVGVIEIVAGLLVLSRYTRFGAYLVSAWLVAIAINLVTTRMYFDIAVRDLAMAIGAVALAKLSEARAHVATGMHARPSSRRHDLGHPAPSMG